MRGVRQWVYGSMHLCNCVNVFAGCRWHMHMGERKHCVRVSVRTLHVVSTPCAVPGPRAFMGMSSRMVMHAWVRARVGACVWICSCTVILFHKRWRGSHARMALNQALRSFVFHGVLRCRDGSAHQGLAPKRLLSAGGVGQTATRYQPKRLWQCRRQNVRVRRGISKQQHVHPALLPTEP